MTKGAVLIDINGEMDGRLSTFEKAMPERRVFNRTAENTDENLADVRYAVVWKSKAGMLAKLAGLDVIFSLGAGVDHLVNDPQLPDLPIVRFVDPNLTSRMVEYVVLQCLMHLRRQRHYDSQQRDKIWHELPQPCAQDFSVGILGFGMLGQAAAAGLLPLGFNVNGWARSPKTMAGINTFSGEGELDEFLTATDILVCLLPHTPQTHGILNRSLFEKLSRNGPYKAPIIINAGRGGSQVEADIVACLDDETLYAASLDVFETEPLATDSSFWGRDNVIISPHMAAVSDPDALANHVATQIARYEQGHALEYLVDRKRGY